VARKTKLDLDEFLPYLINRVGVVLVGTFEADPLGRHRLSVAMWRVLVGLSDNGEQRLVDLGAMTSIDVSTLSRMVSRLARLELVTRNRSTTSEREVIVRLTAKGEKALNQLIPIALQFEKATIAHIPADDLIVVKRALRQMHKNLAARAGKAG